jgi:hypothetical protein
LQSCHAGNVCRFVPQFNLFKRHEKTGASFRKRRLVIFC